MDVYRFPTKRRGERKILCPPSFLSEGKEREEGSISFSPFFPAERVENRCFQQTTSRFPHLHNEVKSSFFFSRGTRCRVPAKEVHYLFCRKKDGKERVVRRHLDYCRSSSCFLGPRVQEKKSFASLLLFSSPSFHYSVGGSLLLVFWRCCN